MEYDWYENNASDPETATLRRRARMTGNVQRRQQSPSLLDVLMARYYNEGAEVLKLAESPVIARLTGGCSAGSGPDLTGYPHLVYAPAQWGEGVRCGSNGIRATAVADTAQHDPIEQVAADYGVSLHEVVDSLRYARANGLI